MIATTGTNLTKSNRQNLTPIHGKNSQTDNIKKLP